MQARLIAFEELELETERLRRLLGLQRRHHNSLLVGEVIGTATRSPFQSLRVARGAADGVKVGMPVITADGIIGRIIRVGRRFSDVQILVDSSFNMDVLLQRTRIRGILTGMSGEHCQLKLHKRAEIRIGDTIISSGIVGAFPKGLPVGRVMRISYESDNVSQIITVEPWVDYRRIEEVIILNNEDSELKKITETAGPAWIEKTIDGLRGG